MSASSDLRQALRGLRRDRSYTAIALLTLAFGIAANTIIFSLVDGVLLRPMRYREAGRLVVVNEVVTEMAKTYPRLPVGARHYYYWREHSRSMDRLGLLEDGRSVLTGRGEPEELDATQVSASLLPMLGVQPRLGRLFTEEEDQPGHDKVALISEGLWRRRFSSDPGIVGQSITLNGVPRTVIGILPAGFHLPAGQAAIVKMRGTADLYTPIAIAREGLDWFGPFNYSVIARLKPGVSAEQARAELDVHQAAIARNMPDNLHLRSVVTPLQEEATGASRTPLLMLLGAVGVVLLIICVNLANLALARGAARQRDVAIRRALGASRAQLIRSTLTEALALGLGGGLLGVGLSWAGLKFVLSRAPLDLPRLDEITLDARVLLFSLGLSVLTGLLFGALPAWRASRLDPQKSLREGGRSTEGRGGRAVRNALVAFEAALGAVLLVVAGLLVGSFFNLLGVEKGFETDHRLTATLTAPRDLVKDEASRHAFFREAIARLEAVPGVLQAGITTKLPLQGEDWVNVVQKQGDHKPFTEMPPANYRFCSPGYFQAAGLKFVAGRAFTDADLDKRRVVISEATARLLWPGESAVGRQFNQGGDSEKEPYEVVGVVRDVSVGLGERAVPTVYQAYWAITFRSSMNVVLHTEGDPMTVARSIRQAVWSLNADTVVDKIETMDGVVSNSVASRRFQTILTAGFAASALLLACVGIYGVVAWSVARRRNEIGIRMALGARSADVHRLIIVQGLKPVLAGLAAGLVGALALGQVLGSVLFGVSARDPLTFVVVAVTLAGVAALACYVPAHRATRTDPLRALRYE